jgi:16S rRNA (cytosine967-C5)-methyltransferase
VEAVHKYKRTIDWVESQRSDWLLNAESRALLYGTLRHYFSLRNQLDRFLAKPLRNKDQDLYCLLLVGAYQLRHSNKPVHAVTNETVKAANLLRKSWAKGLINAVLRRISAEVASGTYTDQSFDHPAWLLRALQSDYPASWQAIAIANNTQAPMVLRVNLCKGSRGAYMDRLTDAGITHAPGAGAQSVILAGAMSSSQLPGWVDGAVAVQDLGAQFAAQLLHDRIGQAGTSQSTLRILDACAAPGGKLAHLLELLSCDTSSSHQPGKQNHECVAIDVSRQRITSTHIVLERLGHDFELRQGDACTLDWWDGQPFEYVLMDAPCSGTGTIRRHPDIKLLLSERAVEEHGHLQLKMLNNLWQTLAPGGTLLYCTCSLLQAENDQVISRFLESKNNHANVLTLNLPSGTATEHGWQLLPTDPNTDGFYYALLRKQ